MPDFQLWQRTAMLKSIGDLTPLLAQWECSDHPAQQRLEAYLTAIESQLHDFVHNRTDLYLDFDIGVEPASKWTQGHDIENYLTPLFGSRFLDQQQFSHVSARKHPGGSSLLSIGEAKLADSTGEWFSCVATPDVGVTTPSWKDCIRTAMQNTGMQPIGDDSVVALRIAWRCSSQRNWVQLWKPTIDALGPLLGYDDPRRLNSPRDDRVVAVEFHRTLDDRLVHAVEIGLSWRVIDQRGT